MACRIRRCSANGRRARGTKSTGAIPFCATDSRRFPGVFAILVLRSSFGTHGLRVPTPVESSVVAEVSAFGSHPFIPAACEHVSADLEHFFRVSLTPKDPIAFEPKIDDATNAAFNRTAAQRKATCTKRRVLETSRFPMCG